MRVPSRASATVVIVRKRVAPIVVVHGGASEWYAGTDLGRAACRRAARAGWETLAAGGTCAGRGHRGRARRRGRSRRATPVPAPCSRAGGPWSSTPASWTARRSRPAPWPCCRRFAIRSTSPAPCSRTGAITCSPGTEQPRSPVRGASRHAIRQLMITSDRRAEFEGRGSFDRGNTVGAVALDANGHLAAATSTGGIAGTDPGASATRRSSAAGHTRTSTPRARAQAMARRSRGRVRRSGRSRMSPTARRRPARALGRARAGALRRLRRPHSARQSRRRRHREVGLGDAARDRTVRRVGDRRRVADPRRAAGHGRPDRARRHACRPVGSACERRAYVPGRDKFDAATFRPPVPGRRSLGPRC